MAIEKHTLEISTTDPIQVVDIGDQVAEFLEKQKVREGLLLVASPHTTLGIVLNERCDELQKDMIDFLKRIAPPHGDYRHNQVAVDGRPNAHSHLLSMVVPSQVTIAVKEGELDLGRWQSLFAVELDGPREGRKVHLTLIGM